MGSANKGRALITGGSRGIGAAVAVRLAADGFPIILNYRSNHGAAEQVKQTVEAAGGEATLCPFDVADRAAVETALAELLSSDERPISVLVNNAGIAADTAFPAMTGEQWDSVTRTTLDGFYNVTKPLVMQMVRKKFGRIINMSSISGLSGNRGQVNYAAAKAGIVGATKALSLELAKRKITVNAIAPGLIETEMIENIPVDMIKNIVPVRRLGQPEEVAALVSFLAGDESGYITGQVIRIDGGLG